jgi:hypothetical protein
MFERLSIISNPSEIMLQMAVTNSAFYSTFDVSRDVEKATEDVKAYMSGQNEGLPDDVARVQNRIAAQEQMQVPTASWSDFIRHYSIRKNALLLFGTAGSWFVLDVACEYLNQSSYVNHMLINPSLRCVS